MKRMPEAESGTVTVALWCRVSVRDVETDERLTVTLVPADAAEPAAGKVSVGAPLAAALMGRQAGESVQVEVHDGNRTFRILQVVRLPAEPEWSGREARGIAEISVKRTGSTGCQGDNA